MFSLFLILLGFVFSGGAAWAAPCCAGSSAAPAMISGDDRAQMSLFASRSTVIGDAPSAGIPVFRGASDSETTQTLRLDGAFLLSDRFQMGASVPLVVRGIDRPALATTLKTDGGVGATGLGDLRVNFSYEALPEWGYSVWKPKGYVFLQLTLPTGRSIYEATGPGEVDAIGRGFYTIGMGSLLVKRWSHWDAFAIPEVHYSLERTFLDVGSSVGSDSMTVAPGWGTSLAFGVGYSPSSSPMRFGMSLQPIYSQPKRVIFSGGESLASYQLTWDASFDVTYLVSSEWSVNANYSDQTLLGPAINSTLSRTVALSLRRGWER